MRKKVQIQDIIVLCVWDGMGWDGDGDGEGRGIKFKFFTICYGSKSLYFWEQKNEPFAHISLRIRAATRTSVSHLFIF